MPQGLKCSARCSYSGFKGMYHILRMFLPKGAADIVMIIWYAALIFLVLAFSTVEQEGFRYFNI